MYVYAEGDEVLTASRSLQNRIGMNSRDGMTLKCAWFFRWMSFSVLCSSLLIWSSHGCPVKSLQLHVAHWSQCTCLTLPWAHVDQILPLDTSALMTSGKTMCIWCWARFLPSSKLVAGVGKLILNLFYILIQKCFQIKHPSDVL